MKEAQAIASLQSAGFHVEPWTFDGIQLADRWVLLLPKSPDSTPLIVIGQDVLSALAAAMSK